jgi:hypothetical protein
MAYPPPQHAHFIILPALCLDGDLSRLCGVPEFIVDDAQFWYILNYPLSRWVWSCLALTCLRVLDETLPIPDDPTDVHFVVQDTIATLRVAVDGTETPITTAGCRDAVVCTKNSIRVDDVMESPKLAE